MGEGIIIFALWYLAIAYNYYIEKYCKEGKDEETSIESSIVDIPKQITSSAVEEKEKPVEEIIEEYLEAKKIEDIVAPAPGAPYSTSDAESVPEENPTSDLDGFE